MAEIRPFRALRYNREVVGDLAPVLAPPYDVIDRAHQDELYGRSPYNVVRLILAREPDRYGAAARSLAEWRQRGVLVQDVEPNLYLYVQDYPLPSGETHQRTGVIGAVRLEPFSSGRIRPHERTLPTAKADRMKLLEACRTNLSPIFGLCPGGAEAFAEARTALLPTPPLIDVRDDTGQRHRLWRITDEGAMARIAGAIAAQPLLIADGHHRYETALAFRDRVARATALAPGDAVNFIMMFVCSMTDPGLLVLPTHRVLTGLAAFDAAAFVDALRPAFRLREFPPTATGYEALLTTLGHETDNGHLGVVVRGAPHAYLASLADVALLDREAADLAPAVRHLDVSLLDRLVLRHVLRVEAADAAHDGRLHYVKDAHDAIGAVTGGKADVAFLLNATHIEEVEAACAAGETMPEKSTYFFPKLLTGLVFHVLRDSV